MKKEELSIVSATVLCLVALSSLRLASSSNQASNVSLDQSTIDTITLFQGSSASTGDKFYTVSNIEKTVPELKKEEKKKKKESEFAPKDAKDLKFKETEEYIKKYKKYAISEMKRTGIPASITMAQAIIESNIGKSRLAKKINNHFGIKCHDRNCKAGHCFNYTDDSHKDFFRAFSSVEKSFVSHSSVVLKKRYTRLVKNKKSYKDWALALQKGGYATAPGYAKKLINIIERHKLYLLDKS